MYQKEIIYMALHKDGSRLGSAGFLKVENRDQSSSLYLKVKNIPHAIHGRFPIRFYNGTEWKEVDGITLQEGNGLWEELEPEVLRQIRLQIILPGGYLIEGISREAQKKNDDSRVNEGSSEKKEVKEIPATEEHESISAPDKGGYVPVPDEGSGVPVAEEEESVPVPSQITGVEEEKKIERIPIQKQRIATPEMSPAANVIVSEELPPPMADKIRPNGVKEDKWEQILDTYDQIHPYGDGRVYVKLEPKDFVILQAKYQHLVNNSFLLHGFYNYRYVILGKENDYYLGVPGVFYDREKMVALMFGFEAFECQGGEARPGDFGYYLRKVEL